MSRKTASLLTKTQRQRVREEFADLEEAKKRRDQQRVRERLRSGVLDFELLADYPDRQLELAFEDVDDETLRAALADATLFVERLRVLADYDRDELLAATRARSEEVAAERTDVNSARELELRTEDEIRNEARERVEQRFAPNPWKKRADGFAKLGAGGLGMLVLLWLSDTLLSTSLFHGGGTLPAVLYLLTFVGLVGWGTITFLRMLKYDLVPVVLRLVRDPTRILQDVAGVLGNIRNSLRRVWDGL